MVDIKLKKQGVYLGRAGETGRKRVWVDITAWEDEYGPGEGLMLYRNPEGKVIPMETVRVDGTDTEGQAWVRLYGTVGETETAVAGVGNIEARLLSGGVVAKSDSFGTVVASSMDTGKNEDEKTPKWVRQLMTDLKASRIYVDTVKEIENVIDGYRDAAEEEMLASEAWAKGTRNGEPVGETDPAYGNNSKKYATDSEAWAVGKRGGVNVDTDDEAYENNAKKYMMDAGGSATAALSLARDSEAWANGTQAGQAIPNTHPAYEKNAKYWADHAFSGTPQGYETLVGDFADVKHVTGLMDGEVFDYAETAVLSGSSISYSNTDKPVTAQAGDTLEVSVTPNGKSVTVAMCIGTSFVDDPTQYTIVCSGSGAVSGLKFRVDKEYKCLHVWVSSTADTKAVVTAKLYHPVSRIAELRDNVDSLNGEVYEETVTTVFDGEAVSSGNTDRLANVYPGDEITIDAEKNGVTAAFVLCTGTSFVDDPTKYAYMHTNSSQDLTDFKYISQGTYKCVHVWTNGTGMTATLTVRHRESRMDTIPEVDGTLTEAGAAADAKAVGDALAEAGEQLDALNGEVFFEETISVYDGVTITAKNTDKVEEIRAGDKVVITCETNGNTASFSLNVGTSFVDNPSKYRVMHGNSSSDLDGFEYTVESGTWQSIHIWNNQANNSGLVVTVDVIRKGSRMDMIPAVDDTLTTAGDAADAKVVGDAIGAINNELYEAVTYSVANNRSLSSKNTDIVCDFQSGDVLKVTCNPNGQTLTLALCVGTSFVDNPSQYTVLYNSSTALSEREFAVTGTYKCLHIWHSTTTAITLTADRIRDQIVTVGLREDVDAVLKTRGKHFACFGDSITSDQVTGIGTAVSGLLGCDMTGNFACGYAVGSDWHNGATVTTPISLTEPQNTNTADNVLSNQVLRCLQYTTAEGAQITWTHPIAGAQSIATSYGTGLGHTDEKPDILYIAIGINDGNNTQNAFTDDAETVMTTSYASLTKCSLASALRWAIETLQSAYPDAQVFVAAPLFTTSNDAANNGQKSRGAVLAKRECIKKIANYCNAVFIDSTYESGYTVMAANVVGDLHPNAKYKGIIARYVANQIRTRMS